MKLQYIDARLKLVKKKVRERESVTSGYEKFNNFLPKIIYVIMREK